jgi:hypothetical protein
MTIPHLELMAVLIGVRCLNFVKKQLRLPIQRQCLRTDSQCVLEWIKTNKPLPVFVRNRVKEIKMHKDVLTSHVNKKENPADIATRGSTIEEWSKNSLWWHVPEWLNDTTQAWDPKKDIPAEGPVTRDDDEEENGVSLGATEVSDCDFTVNSTPFGIKEKNYSSVSKLLRVTAYVLWFLKRYRNKQVNQDYFEFIK